MTLIRSLLALGVLLLGIALPVGAAHGGWSGPGDPGMEEAPADLPPWLVASRLGRPLDEASLDEGAGGLSDMRAVLLRDPPPPAIDPDPLTLRTSGEDSDDLRALLGKDEPWHLMRFGADARSAPAQAKLTAYGAVAYVPSSMPGSWPDRGLGFGPAVAPDGPLGIGVDDAEEPVSLGVKGQLGGFEGGAEYRSVGKRLAPVVAGPPSQQDREGTEVWLAQRLGLLRLKVSQSDLSDNVDRDLALPRTTKSQTAVTAQLSPRDWPVFGLTYATGRSERVWLTHESGTGAAERQSFDSVAGSAYFGGSRWDVSGTSTYAYARDPAPSDRDTTMLYHDLSLTLRPVDSVTVMPSVSTGLDRYDWSGTTNQTGSASLLLSYAPSAGRWNLWTLAAYSTSRASDRTVDGQTTSVSGGMACGLGKLLGGRTTLSVQAGYQKYVDSVYPDSDARGAFALVLIRVAAF